MNLILRIMSYDYHIQVAKANPYNIDREHDHVYTLLIHHSFGQRCFQVVHGEEL